MQWSHSILAVAVLTFSAGCRAEPASAPDTTLATAQTPRQLREVPGCEGCEGCEAAWEREPQSLSSSIRLAGPGEPGEPLLLRGTSTNQTGKRLRLEWSSMSTTQTMLASTATVPTRVCGADGTAVFAVG